MYHNLIQFFKEYLSEYSRFRKTPSDDRKKMFREKMEHRLGELSGVPLRDLQEDLQGFIRTGLLPRILNLLDVRLNIHRKNGFIADKDEVSREMSNPANVYLLQASIARLEYYVLKTEQTYAQTGDVFVPWHNSVPEFPLTEESKKAYEDGLNDFVLKTLRGIKREREYNVIELITDSIVRVTDQTISKRALEGHKYDYLPFVLVRHTGENSITHEVQQCQDAYELLIRQYTNEIKRQVVVDHGTNGGTPLTIEPLTETIDVTGVDGKPALIEFPSNLISTH